MRAWMGLWVLLPACSGPGLPVEPPPPAPDPPAASCAPDQAPNGDQCTPVGVQRCDDGTRPTEEGCGPGGASDCPSGTRARMGRADCLPAGITSCPPGWAAVGAGCGVEVAEDCQGATRPQLGQGGCQPLGDCDAPFPPPQATYLVDPSGPTDATHYTTISGALTAAPAGAVIAVASGEYREALLIQRPVTLLGRCAEQVVVRGPGVLLPGLWVRAARGVTVSGLSLIGHDGGLELDGAAELNAQGLRIEANVGSGVLLLAGSTLRLSDSVVRDQQARNGQGGRGLSIQARSSADLEGVAVLGNQEISVYVSNASLEAQDLIVADTLKNAQGSGGDSVHARSGARLSLERALLARSPTRGLVVNGAGSEALLSGVIVDTVTLGMGVEVSDHARLEANALDIGGVVGLGLVVQTASAAVQGMHLHHTQTPAGSALAFGASAYAGGQLHLQDAALIDNAGRSVEVDGPDSKVVLKETLIKGTQGALAPGIAVLGGNIEGEGVTVSDSGGAGVLLDSGGGGEVALVESLIERTRPFPGPQVGGALIVNAGTVRLRRVFVRDNQSLGIAIGRAFPPVGTALVSMIESSVLRSSGRPGLLEDDQEGFGIWVSSGSTLSAERSTFYQNEFAGVGVGSGARATLLDSVIARSRPAQTGTYGEGLYNNGWVRVERSLIAGCVTAGLQVHGPDARAELLNSAVVDTQLQGGAFFGHGVVTSFDGTLVLERSLIAGNQGAGLASESGGAVVRGSEISGNAIGVQVSEVVELIESEAAVPAAGQLRISADTRFLGNGTRTGLGVVPVPAPITGPK